MPKSAFVQSTLDFAMREINALEQRIVTSEDDTDGMLWEQARQIVAQLNVGRKQAEIAQQWLNPREENRPHAQSHVSYTAKVFNQYTDTVPRPRFRDAYHIVANAHKMRVHHSSASIEHYTPAIIIEAVTACLGTIDLDPCSDTSDPPNVPARIHYTEGGLDKPWTGTVYMNPPYGDEIKDWVTKLCDEFNGDRTTEAIALLPARPDTAWFDLLTDPTDEMVMCFLRGRLTFVGNSDPAPFPSMAVYFGLHHDVFARVFIELGSLWMRPSRPLEWFVDHE